MYLSRAQREKLALERKQKESEELKKHEEELREQRKKWMQKPQAAGKVGRTAAKPTDTSAKDGKAFFFLFDYILNLISSQIIPMTDQELESIRVCSCVVSLKLSF
jgi:hypothetical protein